MRTPTGPVLFLNTSKFLNNKFLSVSDSTLLLTGNNVLNISKRQN